MFNRFLNQPLILKDQRDPVAISWDQLYGYCGPTQVIATALAFRLFEQAFRELTPDAMPERDKISVLTAFPGRGILECIEMITRIPSLAAHRIDVKPDAGSREAPTAYIGRFYFEVQHGESRRSYRPVPGYFDDEFRNQVASWQNKEMSGIEYDNYMSYKWDKAQSILNHTGNLFISEAVPPRSLEPAGKARWFGLKEYADLHK
ncbi:MAG: hypothetical protein PQJ58_12065 [Spirochaetales bacterium]|nr:hypothetical protein [Spirochaetales bacterium]